MEYVARAPAPALASIVDDLYYLAGTPPYPRLTIPPMPSALVIINLAAPFRVTHPGGSEDFADGCVWATPTCRTVFEYPRNTRSVGVHLKPWARTYRFAKVVTSINPACEVDWGEVAHRAGYHDQPHFNQELRQYTGLTPTGYLDLRRRFAAEHPDSALDVGLLPSV